MRQRKTRDEYQIWSNYGYGWEETTSSDSLAEARGWLKDYRDNQPEYSHGLKKVRIRIEQTA